MITNVKEVFHALSSWWSSFVSWSSSWWSCACSAYESGASWYEESFGTRSDVMMCYAPIKLAGAEVGCGSCEACCINKRRLWTARIMLEAAQHSANCFVTLTYDKFHEPKGKTLVPLDVKNWLKRLRHKTGPIRYYLVGEYGDKTQRPHYHVALFGYCPADHINVVEVRRTGRPCGCAVCVSWGLGACDIGTLELASSAYIAGYLVKGLNRKGDPALQGRFPEFSRKSLKPGIGAAGAVAIAQALTGNRSGARSIALEGDVPTEFKLGGKFYSLGRYLLSIIRREVGFHRWHAQPQWKSREQSLQLLCQMHDILFAKEVADKRKASENRSKGIDNYRKLKRTI